MTDADKEPLRGVTASKIIEDEMTPSLAKVMGAIIKERMDAPTDPFALSTLLRGRQYVIPGVKASGTVECAPATTDYAPIEIASLIRIAGQHLAERVSVRMLRELNDPTRQHLIEHLMGILDILGTGAEVGLGDAPKKERTSLNERCRKDMEEVEDALFMKAIEQGAEPTLKTIAMSEQDVPADRSHIGLDEHVHAVMSSSRESARAYAKRYGVLYGYSQDASWQPTWPLCWLSGTREQLEGFRVKDILDPSEEKL